MSGRFLSRVDMNTAKFQMEMYNLALKRGQIKDVDKITRLTHVVCGCRAEGCIFIRAERKPEPLIGAAV